MPKTQYLQKRRQGWYAVLEIPKAVQFQFDGKVRFVKSLQTQSHSEAEVRVHPVVGTWKEQIALAKQGRLGELSETLEVAKEWREDYVAANPETKEVLSDLLDDRVDEASGPNASVRSQQREIILGKAEVLTCELDGWLKVTKGTPKTLDMKRSFITRLAEEFPLTSGVTQSGVQAYFQSRANDGDQKKTIKRDLSFVRGYWAYLLKKTSLPLDKEAFGPDVLKDIEFPNDTKPLVRAPFRDLDAVRCLKAALDRPDIALARLIALAMYTGCRIEELCSLKVADVGDASFSVVDAKTKKGVREVPIHPNIAELVTVLADTSNDGFLLSGLKATKYDQRSNALGSRFTRLKRELEFGDEYVFHSLRRTVITQFENAEIPEGVVADIVGHEKQTMTYGLYSGGSTLKRKADAMQVLSYPNSTEVLGAARVG